MEARIKKFFDRYARLGQRVPERIDLLPALRVNTLRTSAGKLIQRLEKQGVVLEKIGWLKHGYRVLKSSFSLGAGIEFLLGHFYLQESAAQLPVEVLDPQPGELVLDCCSAPGGKTTQIAQHMQNNGVVVALEKKQHRVLSLRNNLERCGVTNAVVYHIDAVKAGMLGLKFDKILLDAPCSGNFAGDKDWFGKRSLDGIRKSAQFQKNLLSSAIKVLKPDGVLVYSTCSLEPEENELNMQWLLENHKVKLEQIHAAIGDAGLARVFGKKMHSSIPNCLRFWPHKTSTEGFFIAKVKLK
jgi:NOL1/NOP2/sun family putative RNA methylase